MRELHWNKELEIKTLDDIKTLIKNAKISRPDFGGFDTETTGLHIILDKPFLVQFGYYNSQTKQAYVYYVDLEENYNIGIQAILTFMEISKSFKLLVGHNIKFDLHMLENEHIAISNYSNLSDTMITTRLATDAITARAGGVTLQLKPLAVRFVEADAKFHEKLIKAEQSSIAKSYNVQLHPIAQEIFGARWGVLKKKLEDELTEIEEFSPEFQEAYYKWYNAIPKAIRKNMKAPFVKKDDVPYNMLNRDVVKQYAVLDVVYTLELLYKTLPVLIARKQLSTLKMENSIIRPLYNMERIGFTMNKEYIFNSKKTLRNYILRKRTRLSELAGEELSCNQSKRILILLQDKFGSSLESTGEEVIQEFLETVEETTQNKDLFEFVSTIQELRTLEKWYSTYLLRFAKEAKLTDTLHTQINQAGAVTGRLSSDFQQFPKGGIKDKTGNVLFMPRYMVKSPKGYRGMLFLDYSQIELRIQAMYTILVGTPDTNLCRAYMPYKCINKRTGELFNYEKEEHLDTWNSGEWYLEEESETKWIPTDVHAATTAMAFPEIDPTSKEFKTLRGSVGKRLNFAKNYGAQRSQTRKMFRSYSEDEITRIDGAYYKAFPGVKAYHNYAYRIVNQGYGQNLFGRRYYNIAGHNYLNAAIQGSGADLLKMKMYELQKFLDEGKYKTKMIINIHDEIAFALAYGEEHLMVEFKRIMETFPGTLVPIVADAEFTNTLWGEKQEVESIEDILEISTSRKEN